MRALLVVQRYGTEVAGGAEAACRQFAEQMALRNHDVTVATTTAKTYVDWAPNYEVGKGELNGVALQRFDVSRPRNQELFNSLNERVVGTSQEIPLFLEEEWMRMQGPFVPELVEWMTTNASDYDVVTFFTYLYYTAWKGIPAVSGAVPIVLHPCAHNEPYLGFSIFRTMFTLVDGLVFFTPEEAALVQGVFGFHQPSSIIGMGINAEAKGNPEDFQKAFPEVGSDPYLLVVGRVDGSKGATEIFDYFSAFKERNPGSLKLVIMGEAVHQLDDHPDVFVTGFVSEEVKYGALAGATALVQPSYFESFSIVLCEAWVQKRPALVQGACAVLAGQARRAGGGLPYKSFSEFETALLWLLSEPELATKLGESGHQYVLDNYTWDTVLDRYEDFLNPFINPVDVAQVS